VAPGVNTITTWPAVWVIDEIVGAFGTEAPTPATNDAEAVDAVLVPMALVAVMVQVYVFAVVSEPTVIGEVVPDADCVVPPLLEVQVAVKLVTVLPPLLFAV
jgi:hypothetical protein